jgi:hypothetical protein
VRDLASLRKTWANTTTNLLSWSNMEYTSTNLISVLVEKSSLKNGAIVSTLRT